MNRGMQHAYIILVLLAGFCAAGEPADPEPKKEPNVSHPAGPHKHTNALSKETSPYLLQHAHNPVNWYPWGEEAFEKAKKEDKPVFLSVGYSSCHWCHVMERESFENESVAEILNKHFISIKVDREERPDVDEIYMSAVQLMTQHGGWPMTIFMAPDGRPFFGGTYFPPEDKFGRMGFKSLLKSVEQVWKENRADLMKDADSLSEAVREHLSERKVPASLPLDRKLLETTISDLHEQFDAINGGFGSRPKFPPNNGLPLLLYLKQGASKDSPRLNAMLERTLDSMAMGGIHDHLAGGFHRYSTDDHWLVPHFEKMLYDNAMLSRSYAQASVTYSNPEYARVARDVYDWVLREMTSPEGGFYSTLDADSEGVEGKFYVWDKKEIEQILGADAAKFCEIYNIRANGNFREEATGHDTGLNIPHITKADAIGADLDKVNEWKAKLLAVRIKRVWPGLDDKILTAWNGLMISSLARGSISLKEPRYKDAAVKAAEFMLKNQKTAEGRWLATHRKGQSKLAAYLDDHAFLAVAFLDLFDATGDERWKKEAIATVELMDKHFADSARGGYYFTADDHEKLLARTKDPIDKAIPSGNGWAGQALVRLSVLTGDKTYLEKAGKLLADFHGLMERAPQATESLLLALGLYLDAGGAPIAPSGGTEPRAIRGPVSVELMAGASALARGGKTPIAIRFAMGKGFHIQANAGAEDSATATRFSLTSESLGKLSGVVFPKPDTLKSPELGGEIKVYSKSIVAGALLNVAADAPLGKQTLMVKVHFQACDDKVCQAPQDVVLTLPVEIVEKDSSVKPQNEDVFKKLKLE
jgi:uncharacterized protein YyaL (SSP411 family)